MQLGRHGEILGGAEELLCQFGTRSSLGRAGRHGKDLAGALTVGRGDYRGVRLSEAFSGEELGQQGNSLGSKSKQGSIGWYSWPQMRNGTQVLESLELVLYRVCLERLVSEGFGPGWLAFGRTYSGI